MRNAPRRSNPDPRGLEAARKRLWPEGNGPLAPSPAPPEPVPESEARAFEADDDTPTLTLLDPGAGQAPPAAAPPVVAPPHRVASRRPLIAGACAAAVAAALLTGIGSPKAGEKAEAGWNIPPVENLTVRGAIRIVDGSGNVVAVFGNVPGSPGGQETTTLQLRTAAQQGARETIRLESLASGATLKLGTPDQHSSMTLVSGDAGPYLLMAQGSQQRVIGPTEVDALPAVSSAPARASLDLLDRRAQALGDGLFAVDMRVSRGRLRGRILNTTSVRHTGIELDLGIGEQKLSLSVPIVSPGNSTGFSAAVPDGMPEALLRSASVERLSSTLRYDAHQPGSESARIR